MRKAIVAVTMAVALVFALTATAALAGSTKSKAAGLGKTHLGNTLGFNAKWNLTGHYRYVAHPATFKVECFSYTWYKLMADASGYPEVVVRGTCTDQKGATIYMETYFIDRGEPGVGGPGEGDVARVYFTYDPAYASDPNSDPNLFWSDYSLIMDGNVQILN